MECRDEILQGVEIPIIMIRLLSIAEWAEIYYFL